MMDGGRYNDIKILQPGIVRSIFASKFSLGSVFFGVKEDNDY